MTSTDPTPDDGTRPQDATEQIPVGETGADTDETQQLDTVDATQRIDAVDATRTFDTVGTGSDEHVAAAAPTPAATPVPAATPAPGPAAARWAAAPTPPTAPPTAPATPVAAPLPLPEDRGPRAGTVVWGLVVAAVGIGILALAAGAEIDGQLALIVLLAAAGVALLVGSVVSSARRRGREGRTATPAGNGAAGR
jgi:hypothetical protein